MMKITYETTVTLNYDQLFLIVKEYIEKKTNKQLTNISFEQTDEGVFCKLLFRNETVELDK